MTSTPAPWALSPLRPLPRRVVPMLDETVDSFVWRLALANGLEPHALGDYLANVKTKGHGRQPPAVPERLIALSGLDPRHIRYAMPELCTPEERATMSLTGRPRPGLLARSSCRRCARDHWTTPSSWPSQWSRHEDSLLCPRHRCLLGREPRDLTHIPGILRAHHRHRRLIRRFGRDAVARAFRSADEIMRAWERRRGFNPFDAFERRMNAFHGRGWNLSIDDPTVAASLYPEVVALTRLLVSPYWASQLLTGHRVRTKVPPYEVDWATSVPTEKYPITFRGVSYHGYLLARDGPGIARFVAEAKRTIDRRFGWHPDEYRRSDSSTLADWVTHRLDDQHYPGLFALPLEPISETLP